LLALVLLLQRIVLFLCLVVVLLLVYLLLLLFFQRNVRLHFFLLVLRLVRLFILRLLGIVSGFAKGKTGLNLEECGRAFRVRYGGLFSESLEHVRFQWSLDRCT